MRRSLSVGLTCVWLAACSSNPAGTTGATSAGATGSASAGTTGAASSGSSVGAGSTTGGTNAGTTSGSSGSAAAQLLGQVTQIECSDEAQCGLAAAYVQAQCASSVSQVFVSIDADLDAGLVTYNAAAAPACLGEVEDAGCGVFTGSLPACAAVFVGTVPNGGSCYAGNECMDGNCVYDSSCPGNCVAYAGLGESCVTAACNSNLNQSCTSISDGGLICEVASVPDAGLGGACTDNCDTGLYCAEGADPICTAQVQQGGACFGYFGECAGIDVCAGGQTAFFSQGGSPGGTCLAPVDVGGSCVLTPDGGAQLVSGCLPGLACVAGTSGAACQIPPASGPCGSDPAAPCEIVAHYCDPATTTCQPKQASGGQCNPNLGGQDCLSDNCNSNSIGDGGLCWNGCLPP